MSEDNITEETEPFQASVDSEEEFVNQYEKKIVQSFKVDPQTAEEDFYTWASAWRIDVLTQTMTDEEKDEFISSKRKLINSICHGDAVVDDIGNIEYTLVHPLKNKSGEISLEKLTLKRPSGRDLNAMNGIKSNQSIKMMMNYYSSVLGVVPATLAKLDGIDMRIIQTVYSFFLAS